MILKKYQNIGADLIIAVIELVEVTRMICEQAKAWEAWNRNVCDGVSIGSRVGVLQNSNLAPWHLKPIIEEGKCE